MSPQARSTACPWWHVADLGGGVPATRCGSGIPATGRRGGSVPATSVLGGVPARLGLCNDKTHTHTHTRFSRDTNKGTAIQQAHIPQQQQQQQQQQQRNQQQRQQQQFPEITRKSKSRRACGVCVMTMTPSTGTRNHSESKQHAPSTGAAVASQVAPSATMALLASASSCALISSGSR